MELELTFLECKTFTVLFPSKSSLMKTHTMQRKKKTANEFILKMTFMKKL